jgi:hypothetical protein
MSAAFIEHHPLASDKSAATAQHAVVVAGKEVKLFKTQKKR